ncbi:hypothetical protein FOL47_007073 [Perkinsus chesapeaki]|uniref:Uncharacterized protein n=1 Tax=Perkinsus chesapeaki TaxID=330153 RepID=A0A7J6LN36_PERCH|nr:hypothetical protein FOL47_007073 [Perkinsus chesapeaki]
MDPNLVSSICAAAASLFAKVGFDSTDRSTASEFGRDFHPLAGYAVRAVFIALSLAANAAMMSYYIEALQKRTALQATVMNFGGNFLFSSIFGVVFFGERMSFTWLLGAASIATGVFYLHREGNKSGSDSLRIQGGFAAMVRSLFEQEGLLYPSAGLVAWLAYDIFGAEDEEIDKATFRRRFNEFWTSREFILQRYAQLQGTWSPPTVAVMAPVRGVNEKFTLKENLVRGKAKVEAVGIEPAKAADTAVVATPDSLSPKSVRATERTRKSGKGDEEKWRDLKVARLLKRLETVETRRAEAEKLASSRADEMKEMTRKIRELEDALGVARRLSLRERKEKSGHDSTAPLDKQLSALHRSRACLATAVTAASKAMATTEEVWDRPSELTSLLFQVLDNAKSLAQAETEDHVSTWRDLFVDLCNIQVQMVRADKRAQRLATRT